MLKFTRKEGEGYKSELHEFKEVRVMVEDVVRSNCRVRESLELTNSVSVDRLMSDGNKPYDEWEAIQQELALYPESRDKDDMVRKEKFLFEKFLDLNCLIHPQDFGMDGVDGGGVIYDEDIKAQMQNAIDDLLRLNGCDDGPGAVAGAASTSSPIAYDSSGYLMKNGGDQYNSSSEMQVDLALNEAVNSIL